MKEGGEGGKEEMYARKEVGKERRKQERGEEERGVHEKEGRRKKGREEKVCVLKEGEGTWSSV